VDDHVERNREVLGVKDERVQVGTYVYLLEGLDVGDDRQGEPEYVVVKVLGSNCCDVREIDSIELAKWRKLYGWL